MVQSAKEYLERERDQKLKAARAITDKAEAEGRSLAKEEEDEVKAIIDEVRKIKAQIGDIDKNQSITDAIEAEFGPINEPAEQVKSARTIGEAFVNSDRYKGLLDRGLKGGKWTTGPIDLPFHGAKATLLESGNTNMIGALTDVQPGIDSIRFERLTIADLLGSATTTSASVTVLQETVATNAAGAVTEGADKPESTIAFDIVTEQVRKIATFLPVSDEMLEDVAQIRTYLDGRLRLFVQQEEEAQLLGGNGTPPNLSGLLDRAIQTSTAVALDNTAIDAIYQAITLIRTNALFEADGIVMNPLDWAKVRLQKDSNEQYYGGGPFTGAYGNAGGMAPNNLWGLPVVVTAAMTQGSALVGAFQAGATVWRRSGLTVEASNSHDDFFQKNLTAIRAEERLALSVLRPQAFFQVTALGDLLTT